MKLSDWGFNTYERRAIWILLLLILLGSAYRYYQKHRVSQYIMQLQVAESSAEEQMDTAQETDSSTVNSDALRKIDSTSISQNTGRININRADTTDLQQLPGIGTVKARAIIHYRQQNGRFETIDELINVHGIGEVTLAKLKSHIVIEDSFDD